VETHIQTPLFYLVLDFQYMHSAGEGEGEGVEEGGLVSKFVAILEKTVNLQPLFNASAISLEPMDLSEDSISAVLKSSVETLLFSLKSKYSQGLVIRACIFIYFTRVIQRHSMRGK
jgi:hypothetical protein